MEALQSHMRRGFSIMEVAVYLLVFSILAGVVASTMPKLYEASRNMVSNAEQEEDVLLFLNHFEHEVHKAFQEPSLNASDLEALKFRLEWNNDGDSNDSFENFGYVYDAPDKRFKKKLGAAAPHTILQNVENFEWKKSTDANLSGCYELVMRLSYQLENRTYLYCDL